MVRRLRHNRVTLDKLRGGGEGKGVRQEKWSCGRNMASRKTLLCCTARDISSLGSPTFCYGRQGGWEKYIMGISIFVLFQLKNNYMYFTSITSPLTSKSFINTLCIPLNSSSRDPGRLIFQSFLPPLSPPLSASSSQTLLISKRN